MRVDLDSIGGIDGAAVVDRARERCSSEVSGLSETHAVEQPEESVAMVVGVDGGEIVGPGIETKIGPGRLRRRRDHRSLDVGELDVGADEKLRAGHWCR